jgi:hypothetical protein
MPAKSGDCETAETVSVDESDSEAPYPQCETGCGNPAVVRGLLVVNTRVYTNQPLCENAFIPADEIPLPRSVDRASLLETHSDTLITTPADDIIHMGDEIVIDHGPGEETRLPAGSFNQS